MYIHIPWCERKCPYCDFNSHEGFQTQFESQYIDSLIADLHSQRSWVNDRIVSSVFIGGGTPSLFSGESIESLLSKMSLLVNLHKDAEVTLECNPSSALNHRFIDYRQAGVNRLSIGVQSFNAKLLKRLGRVHSPQEAKQALSFADSAGFNRWNIDLMHGLPGQTAESALEDLEQAFALVNGHLSWYQLTIERNTRFWSSPPILPTEEVLSSIQEQGELFLRSVGLEQYEVSAFATPGQECHHNLNYWNFGDYVGIGAGAHGKISSSNGSVIRTYRTRAPEEYMSQMLQNPCAIPANQRIKGGELTAEFMMNALRLKKGCSLAAFERHTGLRLEQLDESCTEAVKRGWLYPPLDSGRIATTPLGYQFLDSVVASFL